jgi:hypothetical protein
MIPQSSLFALFPVTALWFTPSLPLFRTQRQCYDVGGRATLAARLRTHVWTWMLTMSTLVVFYKQRLDGRVVFTPCCVAAMGSLGRLGPLTSTRRGSQPRIFLMRFFFAVLLISHALMHVYCSYVSDIDNKISKSQLLYDWRSVSQSVCLGVGHPFGALDQILLFPFFCRKIALLFVLGRPLWREYGSAICSTIWQWSESRMTHNHTLLSHLRLLDSLSVASYDSQGLRWKYSTLSDERTGL